MNVMYKYVIDKRSKVIEVPKLLVNDQAMDFKSQVVKVDNQLGNNCIWCMVTPEAPTTRVSITCIHTGDEFNYSLDNYLGTINRVVDNGWSYVLHLFYDILN